MSWFSIGAGGEQAGPLSAHRSTGALLGRAGVWARVAHDGPFAIKGRALRSEPPLPIASAWVFGSGFETARNLNGYRCGLQFGGMRACQAITAGLKSDFEYHPRTSVLYFPQAIKCFGEEYVRRCVGVSVFVGVEMRKLAKNVCMFGFVCRATQTNSTVCCGWVEKMI
eukprot:6470450-Amphidinium_carterae.1